MIIRLILLFIVVAILMWLLKRLFDPASGTAKLEDKNKSSSENMRQCKYCGTHVPESSIIVHNEQPYCSKEHADRDQQ